MAPIFSDPLSLESDPLPLGEGSGGRAGRGYPLPRIPPVPPWPHKYRTCRKRTPGSFPSPSAAKRYFLAAGCVAVPFMAWFVWPVDPPAS